MSDGSGPLRVYLLRHAHSAWAMPDERDFDRPLDEQGEQEAASIAGAMAVNGYRPALVLCSPARRCIETWRVVERAFPARIPVRFHVELFSRSHTAYVELIAAASVPSILLVGHGPMIGNAASALAGSGGKGSAGPPASGFPTGGLAVIDLPEGPASAASGNGRLCAFLDPREC